MNKNDALESGELALAAPSLALVALGACNLDGAQPSCVVEKVSHDVCVCPGLLKHLLIFRNLIVISRPRLAVFHRCDSDHISHFSYWIDFDTIPK